VDVAADFSVAKVRISVLQEDEAALKKAVDALNRAAGFIRFALGKRVDMRHTPRLIFQEDRSIQYSIQVQKVLEQIHHEQQDQPDQK